MDETKLLIIAGTIHKHSKHKPTPLQQQSKFGMKRSFFDVEEKFQYSEDHTDKITLDDSSARIEICSVDRQFQHVLDPADLCIGLPVGIVATMVKGKQELDVLFATQTGMAPVSIPSELTPSQENAMVDLEGSNDLTMDEDEYILLVSNLGFNGCAKARALGMALLQLLSGELGMDVTVKAIVLAGVYGHIPDLKLAERGSHRHEEETKRVTDALNTAMQDVALFVSQMASFAPLLVIPGGEDLVEPWWPMQPFSPLAFGGIAAKFDVRACTNPCDFQVTLESGDTIRFLGSDGYNVIDQIRQTTERDSDVVGSQKMGDSDNKGSQCMSQGKSSKKKRITQSEVVERMLRSRHICPTQPETLKGQALQEDPFLIKESPNVQFSGNADAFEDRMIQSDDGSGSIKMLCIPAYVQSGEVVLMRLRDLKTTCISLKEMTMEGLYGKLEDNIAKTGPKQSELLKEDLIVVDDD